MTDDRRQHLNPAGVAAIPEWTSSEPPPLPGTPTSTVALTLDDARRLFDLATDSPLVCSGSFETDDVVVLRRLATTIGVDPARATPDEFVRDFPHPFKPFNVRLEADEIRDDAAPGGVRIETDAEVYARLGESPDACSAGSYDRPCRRPAADPIHTAEQGAGRAAGWEAGYICGRCGGWDNHWHDDEPACRRCVVCANHGHTAEMGG